MVAAVKNYLSIGIYTPAEVAWYAREHTSTVTRWIVRGRGGAPAVVKRQAGPDDKFLTFLDFIQALAIASIRRQFQVPLQTIRRAVEEARERHGVEYPFAMNHATHLLDRWQDNYPKNPTKEDKANRFDLFIRKPDEDEAVYQLTGRFRGYKSFKEVVELYLKDVSFGADGMAIAYTAWSGNGGLQVTMNPKRRFGEPLTPSGYTAFCLSEAVKSEGSIDAAAKAYGVGRTEVELACSYIDYLRVRPPCE